MILKIKDLANLILILKELMVSAFGVSVSGFGELVVRGRWRFA